MTQSWSPTRGELTLRRPLKVPIKAFRSLGDVTVGPRKPGQGSSSSWPLASERRHWTVPTLGRRAGAGMPSRVDPMRCTTVPHWRETGYREGGCTQRKVECLRCHGGGRADGSAPEVSWDVAYSSYGVLRRGSMVACVVAYCVVHELGEPEADWLLNVRQNVRGFVFFVCLTRPVASAAEASLMRERVKQTLGDGLVARHKGHGGEAEWGEGKRGPKA